MPLPVLSCTAKAPGRALVLTTPIEVGEYFSTTEESVQRDSEDPRFQNRKQYIGIWDTGATGSVITKKVADELGLKPSGKTWISTVGRRCKTNKYLVTLYLPNNAFLSAEVCEGEVVGGDVLLGMNVIVRGDFAVTHYQGKSTWSFRVPSCEEIDFVKENELEQQHLAQPAKYGRNDPCPCGSGKKYKKCHK